MKVFNIFLSNLRYTERIEDKTETGGGMEWLVLLSLLWLQAHNDIRR